MDFQPVIRLALILAGYLAFWLLLKWMQRRGWVDLSRERIRRGTGNALHGMQEFIQPSVEYLIEAENGEQVEEGDHESGEFDPEVVLVLLSTSLGRDPVDTEEVRSELARALKAGLDWRALYEQAVGIELEGRPFRVSSLPPIWKVAPRE